MQAFGKRSSVALREEGGEPLFACRAEALLPYLESLHRASVRILRTVPLSEACADRAVKAYGYGSPVRIDYEVDGEEKSAVFETVSPGSFGHENMDDRAQMLLWSHRAFGCLPRHVRSLDVGAIEEGGKLLSLGKVRELFLLVEYSKGKGYFEDLFRIQESGRLADQDLQRACVLVDYLASIHSLREPRPDLYRRRVRELIGHGECIMGLTDSYPQGRDFMSPRRLERIEHLAVGWRWRLRRRAHRLCQVHGDFHPWNILFRKKTEFTVLDRSRGIWGEAADDVTCLSLNYLFFSLLRAGRLEGPFETLFQLFWERYLEMTQDREILTVAAPFFAFRGLVMASPVWYPSLSEEIRRKLFNFILNVLESRSFDPRRIHEYYRN